MSEALKLHSLKKGKLGTYAKVPIETNYDLSLAYTPGVAEPCLEIAKDHELLYEYTSKGNVVAVITDGTSVLGLGDIGPEAAVPVMEGKAVLFKRFADIDAINLSINTTDVDEFVHIVSSISTTFGGINLEDISAPRCFEIEKKLQSALNIPVFHDDQHGTAIVVSAAIINSMKLVDKEYSKVKVVLSGAGAASMSIIKMLLMLGIEDILVCDREGIISSTKEFSNVSKNEIASITNKANVIGTLKDALVGADIFIGVSGPNLLNREDIKTMNDKAIVFALANPVPEILPEEALAGGGYIVGTGRSDFKNQINNILAFPGVFRGALDARAPYINDAMKLAAARAIADTLSEADLSPEVVIPSVFDERVVSNVAAAVAHAYNKR